MGNAREQGSKGGSPSSEVEVPVARLVEVHGSRLDLLGTSGVAKQVEAAQGVAGQGLCPLRQAPGLLRLV